MWPWDPDVARDLWAEIRQRAERHERAVASIDSQLARHVGDLADRFPMVSPHGLAAIGLAAAERRLTLDSPEVVANIDQAAETLAGIAVAQAASPLERHREQLRQRIRRQMMYQELGDRADLTTIDMVQGDLRGGGLVGSVSGALGSAAETVSDVAIEPFVRGAFLTMDSLYQEFLSIPVRRAALASGLAKPPPGVDKFSTEAVGSSPLGVAFSQAFGRRRGERIEFGTGFLPGLNDATYAESLRLNNNAKLFGQGTVGVPDLYSISPGRLFGHGASFALGFDPGEGEGSAPFRVASGLVDGLLVMSRADPTNAVFSYVAKAANFRRTAGILDFRRPDPQGIFQVGNVGVLPEQAIANLVETPAAAALFDELADLARQRRFDELRRRINHTDTAMAIMDDPDNIKPILTGVLGRQVREPPHFRRRPETLGLVRQLAPTREWDPAKPFSTIGRYTARSHIDLSNLDNATEQISRVLVTGHVPRGQVDALTHQFATVLRDDGPAAAISFYNRKIMGDNGAIAKVLLAEGNDRKVVESLTKTVGEAYSGRPGGRGWWMQQITNPLGRPGDNIVFPGVRSVDDIPMPTPFWPSEYMDSTIPVHNLRDIRRATSKLTRWTRIPHVTDALESSWAAKSGMSHLAKEAPEVAQALNLTARAATNTVDFLWGVQRAIWTPLMLITRVAWPVRIVAEGILRSTATGDLTTLLNHPFEYLTWSWLSRGSRLRRELAEASGELAARVAAGDTLTDLHEIIAKRGIGAPGLDIFGAVATDGETYRQAVPRQLRFLFGPEDPRLNFDVWVPSLKNAQTRRRHLLGWEIGMRRMATDELAPVVARAVADNRLEELAGEIWRREVLMSDGQPVIDFYNRTLLNAAGEPANALDSEGRVLEWLEAAQRLIMDHTGGDPDLLRVISDGVIPRPDAGELRPGMVVKASDRDNIGRITSIDTETGQARVSFVNQATGERAVVPLNLDLLAPSPMNLVGDRFPQDSFRKFLDSKFDDFAPNWLYVPEETTKASKTGLRESWDRLMEVFWYGLGSLPEASFNRAPLFRQFYWRRMAELSAYMDEATAREMARRAAAAQLPPRLLDEMAEGAEIARRRAVEAPELTTLDDFVFHGTIEPDDVADRGLLTGGLSRDPNRSSRYAFWGQGEILVYRRSDLDPELRRLLDEADVERFWTYEQLVDEMRAVERELRTADFSIVDDFEAFAGRELPELPRDPDWWQAEAAAIAAGEDPSEEVLAMWTLWTGGEPIVRATPKNAVARLRHSDLEVEEWGDLGWEVDPASVLRALRERGIRGDDTFGVLTSLADADQIAKTFALQMHDRILFNLSEKSMTADALRIIYPFMEAWREIGTSWGRIFARNPQTIRKGLEAIQSARESGVTYTDPLTRQETFGYLAPELLTEFAAGQDLEGVRAILPAPVSGVNIFTTGFGPGASPWVQGPAGAFMPDVPEWDEVRRWILPFGSDIEDPGDLANPNRLVGAFTPAWIRKISNVLSGGEIDPRLWESTIIDANKVLVALGACDNSTPEGMNECNQQAERMARRMLWIRGLGQFILPVGFRFDWQAQGGPQAQAQLEAVLGPDAQLGRTDGAFFSTAVLSALFHQLREESGDSFEALYGLTQMVGWDPDDINDLYKAATLGGAVGKTRALEERASTEPGVNWEREHQAQVEAFPHVIGYFAPEDATPGAFSPDAISRQLQTDARVHLTGEQFMALVSQFVGRTIYRTYRSRAADSDGRIGNAERAALSKLRSWLDGHLTRVWRWDAAVVGLPERVGLSERMEEVERAVADPVLAATPAGRQAARYLAKRREAIELILADPALNDEPAAINSLRNAQRWTALRNYLRALGSALAEEEGDFAAMWEELLLPELGEENDQS